MPSTVMMPYKVEDHGLLIHGDENGGEIANNSNRSVRIEVFVPDNWREEPRFEVQGEYLLKPGATATIELSSLNGIIFKVLFEGETEEKVYPFKKKQELDY